MFTLFALSFAANARDLDPVALRQAKGFTWVTRPSNNFDFFVESGTFAERKLDTIVREMEAARAGIERLLGGRSPLRNDVFIVESRARMKALAGTETNSVATGTAIFTVYNETVQALGAQEMCRNLARALWGKNKSRWMDEGLAVYADNRWQGIDLHPAAKWLLDHEKLVPLSGLVNEGKLRKYPDTITYPELGSFVKFVYETYGREAVKTLWQRGAKDAPRAFAGKTLDQVEAEWRTILAKLDASSLPYKLSPQ